MDERTFDTSKLHSFYAKKIMSLLKTSQSSQGFSNPKENFKQDKQSSDVSLGLQLLSYQGEPSINEYAMLPESLKEDIDYECDTLVNRKMKRLKRNHLPKILYLYQKMKGSYHIVEAQIINPQEEERKDTCTINILDLNAKPIAKSIFHYDTKSCLVVVQTIVFTKIDARAFDKILGQSMKLRLLQKIKQQYPQIDIIQSNSYGQTLLRQLFQLFCLPGLDFIIWPSIIVQPIIGSEDILTNIIQNNEAGISQDNREASEIFEHTYIQYLQNITRQKSTNPAFEPTSYDKQLIQSISQKTKQCRRSSQFIIRLIGTSCTIRQRHVAFEWNAFTSSERELLISKSPFQELKSKINRIILCLNQFKKYEKAKAQKDNCLFQLSKIKIQQTQTLCIPLRITPSQKYNILIRCLNSCEKPLLDQYLWVNASQLSVNLALPVHNNQEQRYYYLFTENVNYYQVFRYIYSDFFNIKSRHNNILSSIFPTNEIQRSLFKEKKCKKCYYLVRKSQQHVTCKSCLQKYHDSCINHPKNRQKVRVKRENEEQNCENTWFCQKCAPCRLCSASITKVQRALICYFCTSIYHFQCGKLVDKNGKVVYKDIFACQSCQKCEICQQNLKGRVFYVEQQKILCSTCLYKLYKEFCHKCKQQISYSQIIQCRNTICNKKLHLTCESTFIQSCEVFNEDDFKCFSCRTSERRKLMKWVLQELKVFDEYEYFDDPYYESIDGYSDIIKNPMCFMIMRSKIMEGQYDTNSYQHFCEDLELIATNAMTFNMPRDEAHFRAKILLIVGLQFLKTFKTLLQFTEFEIMTRPIDKVFMRQKEVFYKDLYKNFSKYLLNFGNNKSKIEIMNNNKENEEQYIFSSRHILTKTLMNSQFKYRFNVEPQLISDLFKMPKIIPAVWGKITENLCYYHPQMKQPIIYQCKQCWETYCCTKICYKHSFCRICRQYGCDCSSHKCPCPQLRERQYKILQKQALPILKANEISKLQYTQFHRYCLKCVKGMNRNCYICQKICCFGYQKCEECNTFYHISCQNIQRKQKVKLKLYNDRLKCQQITQLLDYHNKCGRCRINNNNIAEYRMKLSEVTANINEKVKKILQNINVLSNIYNSHGIRLSKNEIISIIYNRFEEYQNILFFFEKNNMVKIISKKYELSQNQVQYLQDIMRQINDVPEVQTKMCRWREWVYEQEQKSKRQAHQASSYIQFNDKIIKIVKESRLYPYYCLPCLRQDTLTSYAVHNTIEDIRSAVLQNHYASYKDNLCSKDSLIQKIDIHIPKCFIEPKDIEKLNTFIKENIYKSYLVDFDQEKHNLLKLNQQLIKYMRYNYFNQPIFYKTLLSSEKYQAKDQDLSKQRQSENRNEDSLQSFLTLFALKAFEDDKQVLCKGNTYLLSQQENRIKVFKRFGNIEYHIELSKDRQRLRWMLKINEKRYFVSTIYEICEVFKTIDIRLSNFEDLYIFLGFSLADVNYRYSSHFTKWMQQQSFHQLTEQQKRQQIQRIYDKYQWQDNGVFQDKQTKKSYKVKANNLFYLNKRNVEKKQQIDEQENETNKKPFISLQDLKKELFPREIYSHYFQEQPQIDMKPLNDVYIAPSKIDRLGLYVGQNVQKNTNIIEYVGQIVSESVADMRQLRYKQGCYLFTLGEDENKKMEIIDATHIGNKARFLNHSCDPNCRAKTVNIQGKNRIMIYTVKEVKKDEELTYDYQFKIESNQHLECNCGSKLCQGRLN